MNINKFISNEEKLLTHELTNPKHIALCFDKNYAMPAGILITSIIANNSHLDLHFHLFSLSIDDDDKKRFKKIEGRAEITLYHVNSAFNDVKYASKESNFPISASIRLIVPNILKDTVKHLLYLDCDMLCTGKLEKLFEMDISNYVAACVLDADYFREKQSKNIGLPNSNYSNSGMLYINTQNWYKEKIAEQTLLMISKNCYTHPDQDALNIVINTKYLIAENKFNYLSEIITKYDTNYFKKTESLNKVILFHFVGDKKPWFKLYMTDLYKQYFTISLWSNKKIKFAPNPSTIRVFSKHLMKKKRYISSLGYFFIYIYYKLYKN